MGYGKTGCTVEAQFLCSGCKVPKISSEVALEIAVKSLQSTSVEAVGGTWRPRGENMYI
jgi:hypothetical protein